MDAHFLDGDDVLAGLARSEADADVPRRQPFEEARLLKAGRSLDGSVETANVIVIDFTG